MPILENTNKFARWEPKKDTQQITSIEMHTGGEPLRVITGGFPKLKGNTILEKRQDCLKNHDDLRKALMFEPRGHADMYGALIVEAEREGSDFGVLFLHNEGYSTMCGHAIIALSKLAFEAGVVEKKEGVNSLRIDAPAGLIESQVVIEQGEVTDIRFKNVPAFSALKAQQVNVPSIGEVKFDLAYGGAFYAYVDAEHIQLSLAQDNSNQIIDWGKKIKHAVMQSCVIEHPFEADLSFLYGVIFVSQNQCVHTDSHSRNVCIFAEGELDRSPTGTGVSGRAALHFSKKELQLGQEILIESILGSQFSVKILDEVQYGAFNAIVPEVSGTAYVIGKNTFFLDKKDPLNTGFIFR